MSYTCDRCGYEAKDKFNFRRHLLKAKSCEALNESSPSVVDLLAKLDEANNCKDAIYVCAACNKPYVHKSGLSRHKSTCTEILRQDIKQDILAEVKDMLQNGHGDNITNNNVTNNTNSNNVTNNTQNTINIHINKFGMEDKSYIPEPFLTRCLKQKGNGVIELARATHFNKNHPHNKNVRAKNQTSLVKYGILEVFNGEKWTPGDSDSIAKQMFDRHYTTLDDHMGNNEVELKKELGAVLFASIEKWFDYMRNCDPDKTRDVKDALKKLKLLVLEHSL